MAKRHRAARAITLRTRKAILMVSRYRTALPRDQTALLTMCQPKATEACLAMPKAKSDAACISTARYALPGPFIELRLRSSR